MTIPLHDPDEYNSGIVHGDLDFNGHGDDAANWKPGDPEDDSVPRWEGEGGQ